MKRSERELKEDMMEVGEVKRSRTGAAEDSGPEYNPFLVEPVLVKLLKLVEDVSRLKELRLMCQTWDEFNLKEIEDRAFNGKVKAIDFQWTSKFLIKSGAEANLIQFLEETQAIPRLFSSFKFNFPESWTIPQPHTGFFSLYPIAFVHVGIPSEPEHLEQTKLFLKKFTESDIWGNFKEITISIISHEVGFGLTEPKFPFTPYSGNIERKLQKLDVKNDSPEILEIFESALVRGKYPNLTEIGFPRLQSGNLNLAFPGLDPSKLTKLEIGEIGQLGAGSRPAREFASGLINLTRNGMSLKNFGVNFNLTPYQNVQVFEMDGSFFANLRLICSNLTQFLTSQSCTLETLSFGINCNLEDPVNLPEDLEIWCKIHLPSFEFLHTLKLWVNFKLIETNPNRIHTKLFGMTKNLPEHFPSIVNLTLKNESSLKALKVNPATDGVNALHLKRLEILDDEYPMTWNESFEGVIDSVEELKCTARLLFGKMLHPWGESLRSLYIYEVDNFLGMNIIKLKYFKKLERISARYYVINGREIRVLSDRNHANPRKIESYFFSFKDATELPLKSITFIGPKMAEELKEEFVQYFPFPVEFKIDNC